MVERRPRWRIAVPFSNRDGLCRLAWNAGTFRNRGATNTTMPLARTFGVDGGQEIIPRRLQRIVRLLALMPEGSLCHSENRLLLSERKLPLTAAMQIKSLGSMRRKQPGIQSMQ